MVKHPVILVTATAALAAANIGMNFEVLAVEAGALRRHSAEKTRTVEVAEVNRAEEDETTAMCEKVNSDQTSVATTDGKTRHIVIVMTEDSHSRRGHAQSRA